MGGASDNIPGVTNPVNDGDHMDLHGMSIKCLHTPCHTRGHILYYVEAPQDEEVKAPSDYIREKVEGYEVITNVNRCVFTGDTLFIGGCGRFFEGQPQEMLSALDRLAALPDDTKVFCGHEYTVKNLEFGV